MGEIFLKRWVSWLVLAIAVLFCMQPVLAVNGTMSITYRGSGGYYIGDTIIFDGTTSAGNATAIRLTGPGLPADGVPVYDLNGAVGTGNPVIVNDDGSWRLVWYTNSIKNLDKMQTARYHITIFDANDPTTFATTSVMMKKPEFYVTADPDTLETGQYLQLLGTNEKGTSDIHIVISDEAGKVYHTYDTSASPSGYFQYSFHTDMPPGTYYVTVSSPSVKNTYRTAITITAPPTPAVVATTTPATGTPANSGTLSVSSKPTGATVSVDSVAMGATPITLANLTPGSHLVEIKLPGYLPFSLQVDVRAGETTTIAPTLVKNPLSLPLSPLVALAGLSIAASLFLVRSATRKSE